MFKLSAIGDFWKFWGFKNINSAACDAKKIWYSPGHIYLLHKDEHSFSAYDVLPIDKQWLNGRRSQLQITFGEGEKLLDLIQYNHNSVLLVLTNGNVESWSFSRSNYDWIKYGSWNLIGSIGGQVTSVLYHKRSNSLFWCETSNQTSLRTNFKICFSSLPRDVSTPLSENSLGVRTELMGPCLYCDLHSLGENVIIWPREPCPPGVLFRWCPHSLNLDVHVHPQGCISTHRKTGQTFNMKQLIQECTTYWAQVQPTSTLLKVHGPSNEEMFCISNTGAVWMLTAKGILKQRCSLANASAIGPDTKSGIYQSKLVILQNNILRMYEIKIGELLQEITLQEDEHIIDIYKNNSGMQQCTVLTNKGIYFLQGTEDNLLKNRKLGETLESPLQLALDEAQKYIQDRLVFRGRLSIQEIFESLQFQSPALMIAMLHNYKRQDTGGQSGMSQLLSRSMSDEQSFYDHTAIHQKLAPYVNDFWSLEMKKNGLFTINYGSENSGKSVSPSQSSQPQGLSEVKVLLSPKSPIPLESRCAYLEILANRHPVRVLQAMLRYLDDQDDQNGQSDDTSQASPQSTDRSCDMSHWNTILSLDKHSSSACRDMPLFDLLCRLMYTHLPKQLAHFVQAAQIVYSKQMEGSSWIDGPKNLAAHVITILPEGGKMQNVRASAMATVDLIMASALEHSSHAALDILLERHLWTESITLVQQQTPDVRDQLFHSLVSALMQAGVLEQLSSQILPFTPQSVSFSELIDYFKPQNNQPTPHVGSNLNNNMFSQDKHSVKIGILRPHLLERLNENENNE